MATTAITATTTTDELNYALNASGTQPNGPLGINFGDRS
jgi:hypothetical protein